MYPVSSLQPQQYSSIVQPLSFNNISPQKVSPGTREVAKAEASIRTNHAARIAFIVLAALFAAASVAIGFFALPLIAVTIPLAIVFSILAAVCRPSTVYGEDVHFLRILLKSGDTELLHRYGKCCSTIDLQQLESQIEISKVKDWMLSLCGNTDLRAQVDNIFQFQNPNLLVSTKVFQGDFKRLRIKSKDYESGISWRKTDIIDELRRQVDTVWKPIQSPSQQDTFAQIDIANVPALILGTQNVKKVSLGVCINPDIVNACDNAGISEITLNEGMPIFADTAQALANTVNLKVLNFSFLSSPKETQDIIEKHFRPARPQMNLEWAGDKWIKVG